MSRRFFLLALLLVQASACASDPIAITSTPVVKPLLPESAASTPQISESPLDYADYQLKSIGIPDETIQKIHQLYLSKRFRTRSKHKSKTSVSSETWEDSANRIIALNIFGFLSQSNYMAHDSPLAIKKIDRYLRDHRDSFQRTHEKYPVSSNAIASLLWVETQYGKTVGTFSLPWVFYSLVLGGHPQFIKAMLDQLPERLEKSNPKNITLQAAQGKVIERCKLKADWALQELKAIHQIQIDQDFNPFLYKASFAGAFGISQFIPSTYLKLAVSEFRTKPDLFKHSDAIASVAHFLQANGWQDGDTNSQEQALFSYNRTKDYGVVILQLAQEVAQLQTR